MRKAEGCLERAKHRACKAVCARWNSAHQLVLHVPFEGAVRVHTRLMGNDSAGQARLMGALV